MAKSAQVVRSRPRSNTQRPSPEREPRYDDTPRRDKNKKRGPLIATTAIVVLGSLAVAAVSCEGPVQVQVIPDINVSIPEARTEARQTEPARVLPFQPGGLTCFGLTSQRLSSEVKRVNEIPLPLVPNIPLADDVYRLNGVVLSELCLAGFSDFGPDAPIRTETSEDGSLITITVDQSKGALFMNRPAIDATTCTRDEEDRMDETGGRNCLVITGEDSLTTDFVEWLPFTEHDDYLTEELLGFTQAKGYDPTCIQQGLREVVPLNALLYQVYNEQAKAQGFDLTKTKLSVVVLDAKGIPTQEWDATEQIERYEAQMREYEARLSERSEASFDSECDVRGFGIAGVMHTDVPTSEIPSFQPAG